MPDVMNRDYVRSQVLRVMADWDVPPGGRGSGPGDVEYWCDVILDVYKERPPAERGWDPYWERERMPREFREKGYTYNQKPVTPEPVPVPQPSAPIQQILALLEQQAKITAQLADVSQALYMAVKIAAQ